MSWISWLEARIGFLGVPRLMQLIAALNGLVFVLHLLKPNYVLALLLIPGKILHGELWRLISYIFVPQAFLSAGTLQMWQLIFLCFYLWSLVWMGDALEQAWGAFRVTLFYLLGMFGVTIAAFFFGGGTLYALYLSLFFAFATLYPDLQIYIFFIVPLKVKWVALVSLAMPLLNLAGGSFNMKAAILVSFLNYFVFFGPAAYAKLRERTETGVRKRKFESKASGEETLHRCVVCKRTERDGPELEFRVSRNGEEYCLDHLPK